MLKSISLEKVHESLGAKMTPFAGFNMPLKYSSDIEEHTCVRNGVGVFDVSHMGEFLIEGTDALALIQKIISNDASKLTDGQALYSCLMNGKGGIVDDLLVYRFNDKKYMLVVNAANIEKDKNWILKWNDFNEVKFTDISEQTSLLAVQGPKAEKVLQKLTKEDISSIPFYHFRQMELSGITDIIVSATGYTGAGGFEVYIPNEYVESIWNQIFEAGREEGIKPIGLGARDTLRLEKGYCLYGNDINDETSPLEAGLGWVVKLNKGDFLSSKLLKKQKEEGISKKLVALKVVEKGIPRKGYEIHFEGKKVGTVSSGSFSPTLKTGIGLGYVPKELASVGTYLELINKNRKIEVEVVKLPFV